MCFVSKKTKESKKYTEGNPSKFVKYCVLEGKKSVFQVE